jgi:hypothetical protein
MLLECMPLPTHTTSVLEACAPPHMHSPNRPTIHVQPAPDLDPLVVRMPFRLWHTCNDSGSFSFMPLSAHSQHKQQTTHGDSCTAAPCQTGACASSHHLTTLPPHNLVTICPAHHRQLSSTQLVLASASHKPCAHHLVGPGPVWSSLSS